MVNSWLTSTPQMVNGDFPPSVWLPFCEGRLGCAKLIQKGSMMLKCVRTVSVILALGASAAHAQACGGSFSGFVGDLKAEARAKGHASGTVDRFFANVRQDANVLKADRAQGFFQRPFLDFSQRLISQNRLNAGKQDQRTHACFKGEISKGKAGDVNQQGG